MEGAAHYEQSFSDEVQISCDAMQGFGQLIVNLQDLQLELSGYSKDYQITGFQINRPFTGLSILISTLLDRAKGHHCRNRWTFGGDQVLRHSQMRTHSG
jgi:hypothetical protein